MTAPAMALPFGFDQPGWLWLILLTPLLILTSLRSLAGLDPLRKTLALLIRSALIVLMAACLAGIQSVRRNDALTVMFLMDRSHSVTTLVDAQEQFVRESIEAIRKNDRVGLVDFGRHAYLRQLPLQGGLHIPAGRLPPMPEPDRTDIGAAVRLAMAMFPADTSKRMVLLSDGNDNMGDVLTEARRARADGIPIDVVPLKYEHRNEVYFDRMIAPAYAESGEQVPLRMVLHTDKRVSGTISLYQNDALVQIPEEQARVELKPGSNTLFVKLPIEADGVQTYRASFLPDSEALDTNSLNNTAGAFTFVSGISRALLLSNNPEHDQVLCDALRSENVRVEMKSAADLGEFDLLRMSAYSTIILANVPAATFMDEQLTDLAAYVKDMGSGLIMLGGDESFGAGGWIGTPVEEVMPVSFEIKHKRVIPKGALVLIMHSCEVPRGNYYGKEMAKKSVDTISSRDLLGVIAYTFSPGGTSWEVPLGENTNKAAVKARIDRMAIGDMPEFESSMRMAFNELSTGKGRDAAQKHVIVFSDGDPSAPSAELLAKYVNEKITVSTVGIGWGAHVMTQTLQSIAQTTGGSFYAARNPKELPQIFSKESKVVRRPLIVEERFPPRVRDAQSELLAGIDPAAEGVPQLGGFVLTSPKNSPHVMLPLVRSTDEGDDPVLAHWQCELGKTVAFTSGYWPAWGARWTTWNKFAKFWAQIVRWTMRQEAPANFDTYARVDGNRARIVVEALDKDAGFLNLLQLESKVVGPGNKTIPLQFAQTGPGHYEAEIDADQAGQYLANIQVFDRGESRGTIRTGISIPFSPEYRDLKTNEAELRRISDTTGGRWLDRPGRDARVFDDRPRPLESKRPVWEWVLAWLVLPLFLLDISARRLANWLAVSLAVEAVVLVVLLFGVGILYGPWWGTLGALVLAELIGWTIRFQYIGPLFEWVTHTVVALGRAGERSATTMGHLKTARDRAKEKMDVDDGQPAGGSVDEIAPLDPPLAKRRFDVGNVKGLERAGDLQEALGGAKAAEPTGPKQPSPPGGTSQSEAATSQLLRAKQRKRQTWEEDMK